MTVQKPSATLRGTISNVSLASLLQLLSLEKCDFTIRSVSDKGEGWLILQEDSLTDANAGALQGVDAVRELLSWQDSSFTILPYAEHRHQRMHLPIVRVLMDSYDESPEVPDDSSLSAPQFSFPDKSLEKENSRYPNEIEALLKIPAVLQCGIADKKGRVLAQSARGFSFTAVLQYGLLTGKEIQKILECSEQDHLSLVAVTGEVLFLAPVANLLVFLSLKKEISPTSLIEKLQQIFYE